MMEKPSGNSVPGNSMMEAGMVGMEVGVSAGMGSGVRVWVGIATVDETGELTGLGNAVVDD